MALPGTSMPMPMPVGDGQYFFHRVSSITVNTMPSTTATSSAVIAPAGSAESPRESSVANPAHFCEIGEESPLSPPMPYVLRSSG